MFDTLKRLSLPRPALFARSASAPKRAEAAPAGPRTLFFEEVEQVSRRERLPFHLAMEKVRSDDRALFEAAFPLDRRPQAIDSDRPAFRFEAAHRQPRPELLAA